MTEIESATSAGTVDDLVLSRRQTLILLVSVMIVALCGIVYELMIAAVSSYLIGNSVFQFSITIGLFMFAMGLGSWLTRWIDERLVSRFVAIEIAVALAGGISSSLLFLVFPFPGLYRPVMFSLIIVIGTLVGLEIPILARILSRSATWKQSIANVLSLDYLGALAGSVAFPLLLLPGLGLFRSSFVIGLLNIGVAFLAIHAFGKSLPGHRRLLISASLVLVALLAGFLASEWLTRFAEGQMYADRVIYRRQTPYQRIVVTENPRSGDVRLYLDKHIQFASIDEHRYHEALVHPVMSAPGPRRQVLILGGGDGMAVREVLKYPQVERIVLVDIDPAITRLCATFPPITRLNERSLQSHRLTIVNADAFTWVLQYMGEVADGQPLFDRVIIDLPDPHNEVLDKLYSREFYSMLRACLSPQGRIVVQASSPFFAREVFWCIRTTLEAASLEVRSYRIPMVSFGIWGFHLACPNSGCDWTIDIDGTHCRYLDNEVFRSSQYFGKDVSRIDTPVNRTFEPRLYLLYEKSMRKR
jgi:spermidine synthase